MSGAVVGVEAGGVTLCRDGGSVYMPSSEKRCRDRATGTPHVSPGGHVCAGIQRRLGINHDASGKSPPGAVIKPHREPPITTMLSVLDSSGHHELGYVYDDHYRAATYPGHGQDGKEK